MRLAPIIVGVALIFIGSFAIAGQGDGGAVWWLVAGLAGAAGCAGLLSAVRPERQPE